MVSQHCRLSRDLKRYEQNILPTEPRPTRLGPQARPKIELLYRSRCSPSSRSWPLTIVGRISPCLSRRLVVMRQKIYQGPRPGSAGVRCDCKRARARRASPSPVSVRPGRADEAQRWQARRAETVLAAAVGRPARRSRRLGRQRKASQGTLAALLRLRPSRAARDGSPISTHQPPPRGRVMQPRGALDRASRLRTGGAESVRRRTRPSRSSGSAADRTGRCAGRLLPRDRC